MKKILTAALFVILFSGCGPVPNRWENDVIVITPIPTATMPPEPVETVELPPTIEATASVLDEPFFLDEFSSALQPGWEWRNEKSGEWSLSAQPGSLQINARGGYVNLNNASNVLLRDAPDVDFQVETRLVFNPWGSDQFAGLILYESDMNFIQAGRSYCAPLYGCVGSGLYMDIYQNGKLMLPRNAIQYNGSIVFLRLIREGNTITFLASTDGVGWFRHSQHTSDIPIEKIGIMTGQNLYTSPMLAVFDYFRVDILE